MGYQERKIEITRTGRVINAIEVIDQERFVTELENVRRAVEHAGEVSLHNRLAVGRKVVIISGPLLGVEGVVIDMDRPNKIYLNVDMFNRAVTVTVSPEQLTPPENIK